jgi:hypothetical protein
MKSLDTYVLIYTVNFIPPSTPASQYWISIPEFKIKCLPLMRHTSVISYLNADAVFQGLELGAAANSVSLRTLIFQQRNYFLSVPDIWSHAPTQLTRLI